MTKTWNAIRILHTLFVCLLVPIYWQFYGPVNFLWFSDLALLLSVVALWREDRLIASTQTLSILLLEIGWTVDFFGRLIFGGELFGLSGYMFDASIPLFVRLLSLFHLWLPWLLLGMVLRYGYDRRAIWIQSIACAVVLPICNFASTPQDNTNWVYGLGSRPQTLLPHSVYLILLMAGIPVCVYLPTHFFLRWLTGRKVRAT